jgi:hypothetical protein
MEAKLVESIRSGEWLDEIKFDGYRALAIRGGNQTRILSRNRKDLGKKFTQVGFGQRDWDPAKGYVRLASPSVDALGTRARELRKLRPKLPFHDRGNNRDNDDHEQRGGDRDRNE